LQEYAVSQKQTVRTARASACWRTSVPRAALLVLAAGMLGCEVDSFFDPSMVGRWERTPTELPILERLDVIEDDQGDFSEATEITPEDLQPVIEEYRFGPADFVRVETWDLFGRDQLVPFDRVVDSRGMIDLGVIGEVRAQGLTPTELRESIKIAIQRQGLIHEPVVSVQPLQQRQSSFSILGGAIGGAGTLVITKPDYRVLQAITDAGGILESLGHLYVIRQVPLSEAVESGVTPAGDVYQFPSQDEGGDEGEATLDDLLQELEGSLEGSRGQVSPFMAPGEVHRRPSRVRRATQPAAEPAEEPTSPAGQPMPEPVAEPVALPTEPVVDPVIDLPEADEPEMAIVEETPRPAPVVDLQGLDDPEEEGGEPLVDLPSVTTEPESPAAREPAPYIFVNGEWIPAQPRPLDDGGFVADTGPLTTTDPVTGELMTQRIIRVPVQPLLRGEARYNIVIRPGDIIRVPTPPTGNLYMGGMIARPGTYNLPITGRMTLKQAIFAAGGLNALGIPERVDLIRRVSETREATVRLNLRAIFEGTEPDLFLKPNDMINVGTNFAAAPLAVMRNGFRVSYGFGFLLDRNFGNDVFGAPPSNLRN
jgi:protein involved in polysaccharide export with SLBB domain